MCSTRIQLLLLLLLWESTCVCIESVLHHLLAMIGWLNVGVYKNIHIFTILCYIHHKRDSKNVHWDTHTHIQRGGEIGWNSENMSENGLAHAMKWREHVWKYKWMDESITQTTTYIQQRRQRKRKRSRLFNAKNNKKPKKNRHTQHKINIHNECAEHTDAVRNRLKISSSVVVYISQYYFFFHFALTISSGILSKQIDLFLSLCPSHSFFLAINDHARFFPPLAHHFVCVFMCSMRCLIWSLIITIHMWLFGISGCPFTSIPNTK